MSRRAKVILIGATDTGKTSIIRRFVAGEFIEAHFTTPIPVQNKKNAVEGVDLAIWDTAGSEDWASMNTTVYHGSDIVIYVASYHNRETLQELSTVWVSRLNDYLDLNKVVKVLAVNKSDLIGTDEALVSEVDVTEAAEQLGTEAMSVSAKQDKGIDELFASVAAKFNERNTDSQQGTAPVPTADKEKKDGCC
jgi:small GTP-binding protein